MKALVGGASEIIDTPCDPIQFGCKGNGQTYPFDPVKAKQLLTDAGYPNGFALELMASAMPHEQTEAIAANLGSIGIHITINEQQPVPALSAWRAGKVGMYLTNWGSYGIADAGLSVGQFFSGNDDDVVRDPVVLKDLQDGGSSTDRTVREAARAIDEDGRRLQHRRGPALRHSVRGGRSAPYWSRNGDLRTWRAPP